MPRYVISASPLVKIYLTEWHDRLLANPELMHDFKTDFLFDVPRGCSSFKMKFNKPNVVTGKDDKEVETLFGWLTGEAGHSYHETDCYGIVAFDPGIDMMERQDEISRLEELMSEDPDIVRNAQKEIAKIQKDTAKRLKDLKESVILASEARIKRAMKASHNNLIKQWAANEEMKMGKHRPSEAEALGAYALDKEIAAAEAKGAKVYGNINKIMHATQGT